MFVWGFSINCPKRSIKNWVSLNLMITSVIVIIAIQHKQWSVSLESSFKSNLKKNFLTLSNYSKCPNSKCPNSKCPKILLSVPKFKIYKNSKCPKMSDVGIFLNLEFRSLEFFETFKFLTLGIVWTFEFGHFDFRYLALLNTCNFWHLEFLTLGIFDTLNLETWNLDVWNFLDTWKFRTHGIIVWYLDFEVWNLNIRNFRRLECMKYEITWLMVVKSSVAESIIKSPNSVRILSSWTDCLQDVRSSTYNCSWWLFLTQKYFGRFGVVSPY